MHGTQSRNRRLEPEPPNILLLGCNAGLCMLHVLTSPAGPPEGYQDPRGRWCPDRGGQGGGAEDQHID